MKYVVSAFLCVILAAGASAGQDDDLNAFLNKLKAEETRRQESIVDMTVTQRMVTYTDDGPGPGSAMTLYVKGDKTRMEMDFNGIGMVSIFDGEMLHMQLPVVGWKSYPPDSKDARDVQAQRTAQSWLTYGVTVEGVERLDGVECVVLAIDEKQYEQGGKIWVDRKRLVALQVETSDHAGNAMVFKYSDYRTVGNGIIYPHVMEIMNNGSLFNRVTVESLKVNSGVDDALFIPGKGGIFASCGGCCMFGIGEVFKSIKESMLGGF